MTKDDVKILIGFPKLSAFHTFVCEQYCWAETDDLGVKTVKYTIIKIST